MNEADPSGGRSDRGSAFIAAGMIGAALILSWGWSGSEPRYELASFGSGVVRMDTDSGELIACDTQRCVQVEQPDRAKTLGPLTMRIGGQKEPAETTPPVGKVTDKRPAAEKTE
jgi:hypothetical protein